MKLTVAATGVITTAPESFLLFITYHKGTSKPVRPTTANGIGNGWSPANADGAIWMCEKSALTINEGEWGNVIRIKGEDGLSGPMGDRGRLPYPTGIWSNTATYLCTAKTTAFVWYEEGKTYYVLNKEGSFTGINPANDYAANGQKATWIPFENFKAVYAEMLFARFGMLGSAVFYDDYMFSQYGIDKNGNETSDYSGFADGTFSPNFQVNLKTGELQCYNAILQGSIKRKSIVAEPVMNPGGAYWTQINNKYNIYLIKSDIDSVGSLFFSPNSRSNDLEFEIYNVGRGTICLVPPVETKLFLWRGRTFERVYLTKAGSSLSVIWGPVSRGVSEVYPTMFIIKNSADFYVDGEYLRSF